MSRDELPLIELQGEGSRSARLYDYLRQAILSGEIRPNERLVEHTLARQARVSRTPVREALHRLAVDGLVSPTTRGVVVTAHSSDELHDLCVAREHMEGLAARLAASGLTDFDLSKLDHISAAFGEAVDTNQIERMIDLNHSFHEALWNAAGNRYLTNQLRLLRGLIERLQPTTFRQRDRPQQALEEHAAIVEALRARDAVLAETLARQHFSRAMAIRLANVDGQGRQITPSDRQPPW